MPASFWIACNSSADRWRMTSSKLWMQWRSWARCCLREQVISFRFLLCSAKPQLCMQHGSISRNSTGYLFTYYNSKVGKEREAQIDRVNEQVKDLYGPLLSCVTASKSAFDAMIAQHSPDGTKAGFVKAMRDNPNSSEAQAYRYPLSACTIHAMCSWIGRVWHDNTEP